MNNTMLIFKSIPEFQNWRKSLSGSVGFIPTMGALHEGHSSLLKLSAENKFTVLSIYVNPTQFNNPEDFKKYPITLENDLQIAREMNVSVVLLPNYDEIYADQYRYKVIEEKFSKELCGKHRPGHFDGVLTIVMKLLNIVNPQKAYFGEKDFQQLQLIKDMAKSFFMPVEIVTAKTVREQSGLAMSSRNRRLTTEGLRKASLIYKYLTESKSAFEATEKLMAAGFEIDYVEDHFQRRFAAVTLENVRLIDNVKI